MSGFGPLFGAQLATGFNADEEIARLREALENIGRICDNIGSICDQHLTDANKVELINKIVKEACT